MADQDEVVPLQQSVKLSEAIGQRTHLEIINGAGHAFDNIGELEGVINKVKLASGGVFTPSEA